MSSQPPMLLMTGRVAHVFLNPDSVDKKTGEVREGKYKVQLLCDVPLQNGQVRMDMQTLGTDAPEDFEGLAGKMAQFPVGVFVPPNSKTAVFYVLKGAKPVAL